MNIGVIVGDQVLYTSDMEVRQVLDLARFSISFATNLVKDASLVGFVHEPVDHDPLDETGITREHVNFTFIDRPQGDQIALCCTYPSRDDMKALGIADITAEQLTAQARGFITTYARRFGAETAFIDTPFTSVPQEKLLKFHQVMYGLFQETLQASSIMFLDEFPDPGLIKQDVLPDRENATFLFASVMHGSVPCASRFFETMDDFFRINVDKGVDNVQSIIENLVSAQLSTIVTTARSIAGTMIREVELRSGGETLFITFYPIKNEYSLALISKGSPTTLRFFTEATAAVLAGFEALDGPFTGDLTCFGPVTKMLHEIPPTIDQGQHGLELDDVMEEIDFEIVPSGKPRGKRRARPARDEVKDEQDLAFDRERNAMQKTIVELNQAMQERKFKKAAKACKALLDAATRLGNRLLQDYFSSKQAMVASLGQ